MATKLGMPSGSGLKDAAVSGLVGAGGGLVYNLAAQYLGNNLIAVLIAIALTGSVVKGESGKALATVLGFQAFQSGAISLGGIGQQKSAASAFEVV